MKEGMSYFTDIQWPLAGLILFIGLLCGFGVAATEILS
jgi:hypothetical protein